MGIILFCAKSSFGTCFGWIKVVESVPEANSVAGNGSKLDISSCCIVMRTNCLDNDSEVPVSVISLDSTPALACQSASIVGLPLVALVNSKCVFDGRVGKGPLVFTLAC